MEKEDMAPLPNDLGNARIPVGGKPIQTNDLRLFVWPARCQRLLEQIDHVFCPIGALALRLHMHPWGNVRVSIQVRPHTPFWCCLEQYS